MDDYGTEALSKRRNLLHGIGITPQLEL
ncbi:hypothetical protein CCACVL1_15554 [Corchorus capsularis]|uniref:Uncharacterized protein n=1 Tax=Corchorus capsularis TaxID=210143 RepID=A0A1R3I1Q6_COCAP|nr:hypothetical protein CCACVL1_15554 [Corchorus capsularis]